jgi:group I intron endonuclease
MHTTPSGKRYIGITAQTVEKRWQNGLGYAYGENDYFFNAIKKYGWDNIKHEILFTGLAKSDAEEKEIELIAKYNTTSRDCGYNRETGGYATPKHTEESKRRMSEVQKQIWENSPERRKKWPNTGVGILCLMKPKKNCVRRILARSSQRKQLESE